MCSSLYLIIMEKEDHNKVLRTSKEQIECYLNFVRVHPEIKLHKNDPSRPKRMEELWALKGAHSEPHKMERESEPLEKPNKVTRKDSQGAQAGDRWRSQLNK
ncbi:uncharacterized protein LOC126767401 [Bactrocera neohumeralis]|uniref:uncharacterized protein LOC126767401 n=1 Tax=Bactrocera neohumeralis TaxID=98809 RepID=UPI0021669A34|nr:uncharacterized protein LOC126767401 [Bactrocera neohumeralis]